MNGADSPIGLVGLGRIGAAVTGRLRSASLTVVGFRRGATAEFEVMGGVPARTPAHVAERCETIIFALPDAEASCAVLAEVMQTTPRPRTVVDMTTMSPRAAIALSRDARRAGISYLEAPVSGTAEAVRDGKGTIFVGAEPDAFQSRRALLELIAPRVLRTGATGSASALKSAAMMMMAANTLSAAEALAYAESNGADLGMAVEAWAGGPGGSAALAHRGPLMAHGNHGATFGRMADLRTMVGGIEADATTPTAMLHQALAHLDRAIASGRGDADLAAVFDVLRPSPAGIASADDRHRS